MTQFEIKPNGVYYIFSPLLVKHQAAVLIQNVHFIESLSNADRYSVASLPEYEVDGALRNV